MAVRWKTLTLAAERATAGMIWTALAALPITAMRLPAQSYVWSHCALCMTRPLKSSIPGKAGLFGRCRAPMALMINFAVSVSPLLLLRCQSPPDLVARATSNPVLVCPG